ncbi:uncharacterized protein [Cicer arietinum]|uniref:Uncharacterized protein LOC101497268 n=1 Tax=Cicer arietinum TaxID=3827 RepID=A0A1S2Z2S4_CICAR|nr:uncharacterized protein LOC101497268 [Cicer arietinum]
MASTEFLGEGASLARPPAFNGFAYIYWKERMLIFLEASGLDILDAIENGPYVPRLAGTDGSLIKKPRSDWVSNCKTAKEMWDTLQETHEGTTDVKRARTNTLMHEYELFNMKKDESINDSQTRFTHVINNMNALGKVTAIAESKDLGSMTIATLFGKLREHEMELHQLKESKQTDRKRKGLSLKAQAHKVKSEPETCIDDSESEIDEEPEIGMLVRKFKKYLKKKGNQPKKPCNSRTKSFSKNETNDSKVITCYECGKSGDIKSEYSDSNVSTTSNPSYEELHDAFNELHDEHIKVVKQLICTKKVLEKECMMYEEIKKDYKLLEDMNALLKKKAHDRLTSFIELERKVESLQFDLAKFTNGRNNLNVLLGNQKNANEKSGIGYRPNRNGQKNHKFVGLKPIHDVFIKPTQSTSSAFSCHFCCKKGHLSFDCKLKKLADKGLKQVWRVKKPVIETNPQGPNLNWVPKSKV